MRLISSADTLNFLSQAAPRPWVTRMLTWMILNGELAAYFKKGTVRPHALAFTFLSDLAEGAGEVKGPKMDAAIREAYGTKLADSLIGKDATDHVYDDPNGWNESDEPQIADAGFFLFAHEIEWELGVLRADNIDDDRRLEMFFPNEELFSTEFDNASFDAEFTGMSFDAQAIELLLPSAQLVTSLVTSVERSGMKRTGRPPKWNWEGVLAYVASQAQHPDGLPTGPGAQARLETIMSDWFMRETGDAPAASQIRQRASSVTRMLEKPIEPEKN